MVNLFPAGFLFANFEAKYHSLIVENTNNWFQNVKDFHNLCKSDKWTNSGKKKHQKHGFGAYSILDK